MDWTLHAPFAELVTGKAPSTNILCRAYRNNEWMPDAGSGERLSYAQLERVPEEKPAPSETGCDNDDKPAANAATAPEAEPTATDTEAAPESRLRPGAESMLTSTGSLKRPFSRTIGTVSPPAATGRIANKTKTSREKKTRPRTS